MRDKLLLRYCAGILGVGVLLASCDSESLTGTSELSAELGPISTHFSESTDTSEQARNQIFELTHIDREDDRLIFNLKNLTYETIHYGEASRIELFSDDSWVVLKDGLPRNATEKDVTAYLEFRMQVFLDPDISGKVGEKCRLVIPVRKGPENMETNVEFTMPHP